jgi:Flp pilus assembly protein TadG
MPGMVERTHNAPVTGVPRARRRSSQRGQSLVEFSIVLPLLLTMVGVIIDAARLYQAWTNLESATRDAAQYLATSDTDPTSPDYTVQGTNSDNKAIFILSEATGFTFTPSGTRGTLTSCETAAQLTTTYTADTTFANGGSVSNPVGTARVISCLPFRTLFAYPLLTNNGVWVISSDRNYKILVGR